MTLLSSVPLAPLGDTKPSGNILAPTEKQVVLESGHDRTQFCVVWLEYSFTDLDRRVQVPESQ